MNVKEYIKNPAVLGVALFIIAALAALFKATVFLRIVPVLLMLFVIYIGVLIVKQSNKNTEAKRLAEKQNKTNE